MNEFTAISLLIFIAVYGGLVMFGPILVPATIVYFVRNPAVRIICILVAGYWSCALIYEWAPFQRECCKPEPCAWCGGGAPG